MNDKEALEFLIKENINGREGFFCLKSSRNLTLKEALEVYRKKDSLEKIFNYLPFRRLADRPVRQEPITLSAINGRSYQAGNHTKIRPNEP